MPEEKTPLKWKFKTGDCISSSPAVVDDVVYFGSWDNHLYAVDATTGEEKWKFETANWVYSSPVVSDGVVYFGSYDKHLYAVDIKTGEERWKFQTEGVPNSPAVVDGVVYFGSDENHLYAVDIKTGKEKWKFKTGDEVSSPIVSEGVVYFGSWDKHLYAVDEKTGEEKWKFKTGEHISSSPTLSDGVVYFGSRDSHLYAVDIEAASPLGKEAEKRSHWTPDTEENLKKIRELMVSSEFNAGIELALTTADEYLLLDLVEDCEIGGDGKITLNDTFVANASGMNYDILVNALFKIIRMINDIQKPDSSLKTKNIKILDLHSFVKLPAEIGVFPNLKTIFISFRHEDNVPAEYSAIDGLEIEIKILYKRDLMRAVWDKADEVIFSQTYEIEVTHEQASNMTGEQLEEVDPEADDYDPEGTETVRISVGDVIDYDIRQWILDQGWFDDLDSGVVSRKDIEDCIYGGLSYLCSSFRGDKIYDGEDETLYLEVETPILSMEDLNPEWTDDEYYLDDEMFADYIDDIM